jgi:hypothetical protein
LGDEADDCPKASRGASSQIHGVIKGDTVRVTSSNTTFGAPY